MREHGSKEDLRFRRQWYIGASEPNPGFYFREHSLSGKLSLYAHSDLLIEQKKEQNIGVTVLGLAFFPDCPGQNVASRILPNLENGKIALSDLNELAGSYAILIFVGEEITIYNDSAGMMGVYYNTGKLEAASTPAFLSRSNFDQEKQHDFKFGPGNDWYIGSTTPYSNIKKLIPNCSLQLIKGESKRFWPINDELFPADNSTNEEIVDKIIRLMRSLMNGVKTKGNALISITGGQDSRVVLAACKSNWNNLKFFTISGNTIDKRDITIAKQLVKKTGINHKFYEIKPTPSWLFEMYDEISSGESIGMRREISGTCIDIGSGQAIHVNGNLGAICKSYYWHSKNPQTFEVASVIKDFISPGQLTIDSVEEWLATVPSMPATSLYNLFYLEQRGGRWMSAGENCSRLFYETFTPFNHRKLFSLVSSLSTEIQYGGTLLRILASEMAPELSEIPYAKARRNWSKYIPEKIKNRIRKLGL